MKNNTRESKKSEIINSVLSILTGVIFVLLTVFKPNYGIWLKATLGIVGIIQILMHIRLLYNEIKK